MKSVSVRPNDDRERAAGGSPEAWDIALDESPDGPWTLELDGPRAYLVFQIKDTGVFGPAARLLRSALKPTGAAADADLLLGHFGAATVSLVRDDEDFPRCFVVVGPRAKSTLRVSLYAADIRSLADAFRRAERDLLEG